LQLHLAAAWDQPAAGGGYDAIRAPEPSTGRGVIPPSGHCRKEDDGMRRFIAGAAAIVAALVVSTQPAAACAGLIGPNGAVILLAAPAADAVVLMQVKIDALDITVLSGGGESVGRWATEHGFRLPPDAPEILDFYAARSPIFMAAIFDADAAKAKGQQIGDGTPVHIMIPTANPWVPLRILATGKNAAARVDADVYLLTDRKPLLLPAPFANGMELQYSQTASASLLNDLRSDKGMDWVSEMAWLTKIGINAAASQLTYDLAISANGKVPSRVAAGLEAPANPTTPATNSPSNQPLALVGIAILGLGAVLLLGRFAPRSVAP